MELAWLIITNLLYVPNCRLDSSSVLVANLISTASSMTKFMNSSNPCVSCQHMVRRSRRGFEYPNLALDSYGQLFKKPDLHTGSLLEELEDEVDGR